MRACVRHKLASKRHSLQSDVHHCDLCFNYVVRREAWDSHCWTHLRKLPSKKCGTITYCHTLIRPGYQPGNGSSHGAVTIPSRRTSIHTWWDSVDLLRVLTLSVTVTCPMTRRCNFTLWTNMASVAQGPSNMILELLPYPVFQTDLA